MNVRLEAMRSIGKRARPISPQPSQAKNFASRVFSRKLMQQTLSRETYQNFLNALSGREKLQPSSAGHIASALQQWASEQGATHFAHWFQPLTGFSAEKHDSFLSWDASGHAIATLRSEDLLRGEPDASSFPTGGVRTTHQARGYTTWDIASSPFLWESAEGLTLRIPSLFFSWTGLALDHKIPLLRSDEKMERAALRLLKLCDIPASRVFSTLGPEQEYFLIDRNLYLLRPDLLLSGRTVFGARPPKGQELEDHYFGAISDRVIAFMRESEEAMIQLGIPAKTRHNEVAPAQYEIAPLFEPASIAVDHNILLMELMQQIALKHDLACLFHEKPFAYVNGSGKHNNWSLGTDTGLNLFKPRKDSLLFLTLLAAVLRAVHDHAALLRASIGSAGNDHRLCGSEAPPTILSIYLGDALEQFIHALVLEKKPADELIRKIDLGLPYMNVHEADLTDRNRTSFFAFTGNKFEFRAVGASAHCAFPITVLNAIVADTLHLILDEIADVVKDRKIPQDQLLHEALPVLRRHFKIALPILFGGNAYASEWEKEAQERGLPNIRKSLDSFAQILDRKTKRVFEGILTEEELQSRFEILVERYAKTLEIEARLMAELFQTQILPAAMHDLQHRTQSIKGLSDIGVQPPSHLLSIAQDLAQAIDAAIHAIHGIAKILPQTIAFGWEAKAKTYCEVLEPRMSAAREAVDLLETLVDNTLWQIPKYRELLFVV